MEGNFRLIVKPIKALQGRLRIRKTVLPQSNHLAPRDDRSLSDQSPSDLLPGRRSGFTFYLSQRAAPRPDTKKGSPFPDCLFEKRESRGERHAIRIRLLLGSSLFLSGFLFRCLLLGSCLEGLLFKRCLCCCKAGDRDAER